MTESRSHLAHTPRDDNSRSASRGTFVNLNRTDDRRLFPWPVNRRREGMVTSEGPERSRGRCLVSGFADVGMWKCR